MSDSIYAPPEAEVAAPRSDEPRYYVVAPLKFLLLSFLTLTLYFVYWFYRNWRQIKNADNEDIWPPARGFFYFFFTHSLFADIDSHFETQGRSYDWNPNLIATVFVIIVVISGLPDRLWPFEMPPLALVLMPLVMTIVLTMLLFQGQKAINSACDDVQGNANGSLTAANWVWMILGGLFWLTFLLSAIALLAFPEISES